MRYAYPVEIMDEPDGITITCPDVPEMVTGGWGDLEANLDAARDALATALSGYVDESRPIPRASRPAGRHVVAVPALAAAKLALHEAMLDAGVSNAELGQRMGLDEDAVRKLRDPLHNNPIETVEAALLRLGKHLDVVVRSAA